MGNSSRHLIAVFLTVCGLALRFYPPERINNSLGYRTPFAMKGKETWYEGNRFFGLMVLINGIIIIPFSALMDYLYKDNLIISRRISSIGFMIICILSILGTEVHLRRIFDKNGVRRKIPEKSSIE